MADPVEKDLDCADRLIEDIAEEVQSQRPQRSAGAEDFTAATTRHFEALSERLRRWASLFHSIETFVPVADPGNNKNPKDYGFIPCYAVTHADAAQDIDFLTQELASVLDDIANIER